MNDSRRKSLKINLLLWILYQFLRGLSWLGMHVFYRKICVLNKKNARFDGPAIVVSNHPSTLMDPLNVGIQIPRTMFFLANYGLFKNPVGGWLLQNTFAIPVKRKEDVADGENRSNNAAFKASFDHLKNGGILYIAAEGTSWMNRWIRPLKTGAARIVFGAENQNGWSLDTKIIPVGLSYDAPNLFRSRLTVNFGEAILVKNWQENFEKNASAAVDELTQHIENQLKTLTIDTRDEAGEKMIGQLEEILENDKPLACAENFERSKNLTARFLDDEDLRGRLNFYFEKLKENHLTDSVLAADRPTSFLKKLGEILVLIFGLPIFLVGYGFCFLPCFLPFFMAKKLKLYVGYDSNIKMVGGVLTFSAALLGLYFFTKNLFENRFWAVAAIGTVILAGYFSEKYLEIFNRFWDRQKADSFKKSKPEVWEELVFRRSKF